MTDSCHQGCAVGEYCDEPVGLCDKCSTLCHTGRGLTRQCKQKCPGYSSGSTTIASTFLTTTVYPMAARLLDTPHIHSGDHFILFVVIFCSILIILLAAAILTFIIMTVRNQQKNKSLARSNQSVRFHNQNSQEASVNIEGYPSALAARSGSAHEECDPMLNRQSCERPPVKNDGKTKYMQDPSHHKVSDDRHQLQSISSGQSSQGNHIYESVSSKRSQSSQGNNTYERASSKRNPNVPRSLNTGLNNNNTAEDEHYSCIPEVPSSEQIPARLPEYANGQTDHQAKPLPYPIGGQEDKTRPATSRQMSTQTDEGIDCSADKQDSAKNSNESETRTAKADKTMPDTAERWNQETKPETTDDDLHPPVSFVRNKHIYDTLRKLPYIDGYYSEGRSIQVFVDTQTIDEVWLANELEKQTGQHSSKFHIRPSEEQN